MAVQFIVGAEAILIRHCYEFEPEWLGLLEELHHCRVVPLGLMPPTVHNHATDMDHHHSWMSIKDRLDHRHKGSVMLGWGAR